MDKGKSTPLNLFEGSLANYNQSVHDRFIKNVKKLFGNQLEKLNADGMETAIKPIMGFDLKPNDDNANFHKKDVENGEPVLYVLLPKVKLSEPRVYVKVTRTEVVTALAQSPAASP